MESQALDKRQAQNLSVAPGILEIKRLREWYVWGFHQFSPVFTTSWMFWTSWKWRLNRRKPLLGQSFSKFPPRTHLFDLKKRAAGKPVPLALPRFFPLWPRGKGSATTTERSEPGGDSSAQRRLTDTMSCLFPCDSFTMNSWHQRHLLVPKGFAVLEDSNPQLLLGREDHLWVWLARSREVSTPWMCTFRDFKFSLLKVTWQQGRLLRGHWTSSAAERRKNQWYLGLFLGFA